MCKILLSINPEHVDNILSGRKQFEFRKVKCRKEVDSMLIYATSPIMMVVGEAEILEIIEDAPELVWEMTSESAGISKSFFDQYYVNKTKAIAYRLGKVEKYKNPFHLADLGVFNPPQSFMYIT